MSTNNEPLGAGSLAGRVAWLTGAGRGLGRAVGVGLAAAGARLAISARSVNALQSLAEELTGTGTEVLVLPGSVSDPDFADAAADRIAAELGSIDVLVNMAGTNPRVVASEELTDEAWQEVIDVNLTGTFRCARAAARHMLAVGRGSIINISSVHGSTGVARMCAYAASKGGVETLTKALAVEWADRGVRVNCVAPGYFTTALTERYLAGPRGEAVLSAIPMGRAGCADELVGVTRLLACDEGSYITGSVFLVDGGWTAL
jgi:NAD(P)-dependent dehydrogenase (short-subunit alcohol dehydrogenase family)